jgi:hypothetical protein
MEQKNKQTRECNGNGISISDKDYIKFMMSSVPIDLPKEDVEKRKLINRVFHDSCMIVQTSGLGNNYVVGPLNWTDARGYSITVNGEAIQISYSETARLFKPDFKAHFC